MALWPGWDGKSTISTMIARKMRKLGRLGAFFFFDRDIPDNANIPARAV
jgi:hypothetical protein